MGCEKWFKACYTTMMKGRSQYYKYIHILAFWREISVSRLNACSALSHSLKVLRGPLQGIYNTIRRR